MDLKGQKQIWKKKNINTRPDHTSSFTWCTTYCRSTNILKLQNFKARSHPTPTPHHANQTQNPLSWGSLSCPRFNLPKESESKELSFKPRVPSFFMLLRFVCFFGCLLLMPHKPFFKLKSRNFLSKPRSEIFFSKSRCGSFFFKHISIRSTTSSPLASLNPNSGPRKL